MSKINLTDIDGTARFTVSDAGIVSAWGFNGNITGTASVAASLDSGAIYKSASDVTATGSAQSIAHGLGTVPILYGFEIRAGTDGSGGAGTQVPTITEGTHTTTNLVVTVTAGAKFRAWAIK